MSERKTYLARAGFAAAGAGAAILIALALSGAPVSQAETASSASASSHAAPRCLDGHRIGRIHVVNGTTLLVYDSFENAYKLDIGDGPCRAMNDLSHIGFEFKTGSDICAAHDAEVLYSEHGERPLHCLINGVTPLSRDEAKALDKD